MPLVVFSDQSDSAYLLHSTGGANNLALKFEPRDRGGRASFFCFKGNCCSRNINCIDANIVHRDWRVGFADSPCIRFEDRKPEKETIDIIIPITCQTRFFAPKDQYAILVPTGNIQKVSAVAVRCRREGDVLWWENENTDLRVVLIGRDRIFVFRTWVDAAAFYKNRFFKEIPHKPEKLIGVVK